MFVKDNKLQGAVVCAKFVAGVENYVLEEE